MFKNKKFFLVRVLTSFFLVIAGGLALAGSLSADGLIIVPRPPAPGSWSGTPFPLEVKYHRVEVGIDGQAARTSIDQEFYNPTNSRLEGIYFFPVPEGAVINNFSMEIDGKMTTAELLDAEKARTIYEDIVRRMKDPALLEYSGRNAFKVRIFPIEPFGRKRTKISYTQILRSDNGVFNYTYPLNTEKFSAKPLEEVSLRVKLRNKGNLKNIFSPTHQVEVKRRSSHEAIVGFEEKNVKPDADFSLYWNIEKGKVGLSILTYRPVGEDGFFFLAAAPDFQVDAKEITAKDITFVLDTSGSMAGKKLEQAKRALLFCLENLNAGDGFELVRFATESENLFGKIEPVSTVNINRAKDFIRNLKPIGGTNMEEALAGALEVNRGEKKRPGFIIFLTDGKPTIGATKEETLVSRVRREASGGIRVFTFGVGDDINTHLLDRISEATGGLRFYVRPDEDLEVKLSNFYEKIKSPVLVDFKVKFGPGARVQKLHPNALPDLFKGDQLILFGRYTGSGETVLTLSGVSEGKKGVFEYRANFPESNPENDFIAPLWAARRIGYLLDEIRLRGESPELKDEVIDLARRYGIITPYTSYLIIEDEKNKAQRRELPEDRQTLNAMPGAPVLEGKLRADYEAMRQKSGSDSVTVSKEASALKSARNYNQINQGADRLDYSGPAGTQQNLANQVKNVGGRAFYQAGKFWVDSKVQAAGKQQAQRIQIGGPEYFQFLKDQPESARFLALGQNVRFLLHGQLYEIHE
ncbi:MAG: VIT and VWA domain-containing protein [Candidatus Omnitrophota bacterium]